MDQEDQGDYNPPGWTRTGFYILLILKEPGEFLSPRFKPYIAPLATYQYTFPNTIYLATIFTTILFYHNLPALYVTITAAAYSGQNRSVEAGEAERKRGPPRVCPEFSIKGQLNLNTIHS